MSGKRDIVQRLVRGELTEEEKLGYSEDNIQYATENPAPREPRKISFALGNEEKIIIYQNIKMLVVDGMTPDDISKSVVIYIDKILSEKEAEAYGDVLKSQNKGGFRRVE